MDEPELARAFEARRPRLRAVAYRILGTRADCDDAVQEAWLRLQRADEDTIDDLDAWLTTVTARVSLNLVRAQQRRRERPHDDVTEPIVAVGTTDDPEHETLLADAVGIALQVVLDTLEPDQRVAFVLHDMFSVPFGEIAELLQRSPDSARQLASRARRRVADAAPEPDRDPARQRAAVDAYFAAAREGDLDGLVSVLAPDVTLRSHGGDGPPLVLSGVDRVARGAVAARELAPFVVPALVNGTAGAVAYDGDTAFAILAFTVAGGRVRTIDVFRDPAVVARAIGAAGAQGAG